MAENCGVSWITVHGRTVHEKTSVPVHLDAIKIVKEHSTIPIIANGDIFTSADFDHTIKVTGCDGAMSARGLLENPMMFRPDVSAKECAKMYVQLAMYYGGSFVIHHNHVYWILQKYMNQVERKQFRSISSLTGIVHYFIDKGWWDSFSPYVPPLMQVQEPAYAALFNKS